MIKKIKGIFLIPLLLTTPFVLFTTSCSRDWNEGVKYKDLKEGDDLSDKCVSFDILPNPWTATCSDYDINAYFIEFFGGYAFSISFGHSGEYRYVDMRFQATVEFDTIMSYYSHSSWSYASSGNGNFGSFYRNRDNTKLIYKFKGDIALKIKSLTMDPNIWTQEGCVDYIQNHILFGYF